MRAVPAELQARLDSGATTLARCWRVALTDGRILGFTNHDRPLSFGGVTFEAASGLDSASVERSTGLSADSHSVAGALRSATITETDIRLGVYDGAEVQLWLVDWADVEIRMLLSTGTLGEIRRTESAFEAEVIGIAEALNQPVGRSYQACCDLRVGDSACGVDLSDPEFTGDGTVEAVAGPETFTVTGLSTFRNGWFSEGVLVWLSGANQGQTAHVKNHRRAGGDVSLSLWRSPGLAVAPGDTFRVTAGCDKRAVTCRNKFDNFLNFRGFPHMPGDDRAAGYPGDERHNGGSLLRG